MPDFPAAAQALHAALHQLLAEAGCLRGRFDISEPNAQLSLSGQRPDGKTRFFWEFSRPLRQLASRFLQESRDADTTQLTILIDVAARTFAHERTSRRQQAEAQQAEEQHTLAQQRAAPRDHTPYGPALAAQVAARLDQGAVLAYAHRDYCGLGLTRTPAGHYHYAPVYDGDFEAPEQKFATRAAFEQWLAAQSDYSLAGLASPDPWVWDNQRLTRQRLAEFVAGG